MLAIVAPSGFGKSVLAGDVAEALGWPTVLLELTVRTGADGDLFNAALRRSLRAAGLRSLAESPEWFVDLLVERDDPVLVIVDESQFAAGSGQVVRESVASSGGASSHSCMSSRFC